MGSSECPRSDRISAPEFDLLIGCARLATDVGIADRLRRILRGDLDWSYVRREAIRHGVMPLLYRSLCAIGPEAVPVAILEELRAQFFANARRNLVLTGELLRILDLLEGHGIPAIPLKGPVLAAAIYGDLSLRQFTDLDILVDRRDAVQAREVLIAQGYEPLRRLTPAQVAAHLRYEVHDALIGPRDRVGVELHWAFAPPCCAFALLPREVWGRLCPVVLGGRPVRTLAPADLLLFLCVHGAKHEWERLEWICGVAELLGGPQCLAWPAILLQCHRLGIERALHVGLLLAQDVLDAHLPPSVARVARADPAAQALAQQARDRLFCPESSGSTDVASLAHFSWFYFRSRERLADRLRYVLRAGTTPLVYPPLPLHLRLSDIIKWLPLPQKIASALHALLRLLYRAMTQARRGRESRPRASQ